MVTFAIGCAAGFAVTFLVLVKRQIRLAILERHIDEVVRHRVSRVVHPANDVLVADTLQRLQDG